MTGKNREVFGSFNTVHSTGWMLGEPNSARAEGNHMWATSQKGVKSETFTSLKFKRESNQSQMWFNNRMKTGDLVISHN